MMSEPLSDSTVFISYLEMTRARPLDSCAQAQTSNIYVFVCVCVCFSSYQVQIIGVNAEASQ